MNISSGGRSNSDFQPARLFPKMLKNDDFSEILEKCQKINFELEISNSMHPCGAVLFMRIVVCGFRFCARCILDSYGKHLFRKMLKTDANFENFRNISEI